MTNLLDKTKRITVVDALRGFALVSIMLLHNIERFEVHSQPENLPLWLTAIDKAIWDTFFFLFGGKSYAIFALLFGLTFYIQTHNRDKEGKDFRPRFLWRLFLLLIFGMINTMFYRGEILVLYALVGILIIPFAKLNNRIVFISALIFLAQPIFIAKLVAAINAPDQTQEPTLLIEFYNRSGSFLENKSFLALVKSNLTDGRIASLLWFVEFGRVSQSLGLFLIGFIGGRKRIFHNTPENISFWKKTLLIAFIAFIPLFFLKSHPEIFTASKVINNALGAIIGQWSNLAFTAILVATFILLFYNPVIQPWLDKLSPIGKMSLTNYIIQSIIGASIYYGFGLALYQYVGPSISLCIGILLAIIQGIYSTLWFKNHKRGPLENLWHKLTWAGTDKQ